MLNGQEHKFLNVYGVKQICIWSDETDILLYYNAFLLQTGPLPRTAEIKDAICLLNKSGNICLSHKTSVRYSSN